MDHYICIGGCRGVSDKPGVCQAPDCPDHGKPLLECDCTDDQHYGRQHAAPETQASSPKESPPSE